MLFRYVVYRLHVPTGEIYELSRHMLLCGAVAKMEKLINKKAEHTVLALRWNYEILIFDRKLRRIAPLSKMFETGAAMIRR